MKGVILAGGTGSRLAPLTSTINKHLLPVYDKPMLYYPIEKLVEAGITSIKMVVGIEHAGTIINCIGSGERFGCSISYAVQEKPGGIAHALGLCRNFCYGDKFCVILGDNIFQDTLTGHVQKFASQERGARVLLKEVSDPQRFGVAKFDKNRKLLKIEEKPKDPPSNYAVTGIYFYDQKVFNIIDNLLPSGRGELEITDVNNTYLEWGELDYSIMGGYWTDCGTFDSLFKSTLLVKFADKYDMLPVELKELIGEL